MNTLHRVSAGAVALAMMIQPVLAAGDFGGLTFSRPVQVTEDSTPGDVLKQSDNWKDGVLTVDGREFVIDAHGHAVLKQPDEGWLCGWFGWWCPELAVGEISVDQAKAKERVVAQAVTAIHAEMVKDTGRVQPLLAFAYPEPLPAGTVIYQDTGRNLPMNVLEDSWFFFLDLEPHAYFDHRAEFVLVDAKTGELTRNRVFSPPVIGGKTLYKGAWERWSSDQRFYPASLEDLPEPSPWPLQYASPKAKPDIPEPPAGTDAALAPEGWLPSAHAAGAPAADPADPCAGKERRKVAVTVVGEGPGTKHDDGFVDGEDMAGSEAAIVSMLGEVGVAHGDIHRFNPENTETVEQLFEEIRKVTKDLGPCDKFYFYVFAHGTIYDENGDHIPDSPSDEIVYGHGEKKEYIGKGRWHKLSLLKLLEEIKAQDMNFILESCYSGSVRECMANDVGNPPPGTTWHVFLASGSLRPSYTLGGKPGAEYSLGLASCVDRKLAERGITYPTIEQTEQIMKECQKEMAENPTTYLRPALPEEYGHTTYTVSPDQSVIEGNSGVKYVEFTITRSPVTDHPVNMDWRTYDSNPDGDPSDYANPQDYQWVKKGDTVYFEPGQATATIRVAINGDTAVEEDETFGVWFSAIKTSRFVTIVDDDKPVTAPSSSSAGTALSSSEPYTVSVTVNLDGMKTGDLNAGGYYVLDGLDLTVEKGKPVTITIKLPDEPVTKDGGITVELDAKCPTCEELAEQAMLQAQICAAMEQDLADAQAELADFDRRIASGDKDVKAAQDALNAFNNPKSSASSNGRTVTSSDLQAGREWAAGLWAQYQAGDLTAQELEAEWREGMSDAERQKIKDDIRARLEAEVAAAKARAEKLKADRAGLAAEAAGLKAGLDACNEELDRLIDAWMDCEESCVETDATIGVMTGGGSGGSAASKASSSSSSSKPAVLSSSSSSSKSSSSSPHRDVFPSSSSSSSRPVTTPVSSSSSSRTVTQPMSSSKSSSSAPSAALCPNGTTPNRYECEEFCGHENGTCVQQDGCWSCTVAQCPSGTYTNTCPASCAAGCDVVGQDGSTQCLQCKKSCTEVCSALGAQVGSNWNTYIQAQLNQYTCVSGASVEIETTTAGSCSCSTQPTVQVDSTPPVCKGTPCGDVVCGGSASCQQGEATVTVNCNWGGWQNVGENQFKPVIGQ